MSNGKTFAERVLKGGDGQDAEVREGVGKERQYTARAADLELRSKDGHMHEAISWALFQRRRWRMTDSAESLVLIFVSAVVSIEGHNLQRLAEMIREERLEAVQEHDTAEAKLLEAQNQPLGAALRKAIVTRIAIEPPFERAVDDVATLAEGETV